MEEKVSSNMQARTGRLKALHEGIQKAAEEVCDMTSRRGHRERRGGGMRMCKEQLKKRRNLFNFGRKQKRGG